MNGKVLVEKAMATKEAEIDLTAFESGIYFIEITSENKKSVQRIVKE